MSSEDVTDRQAEKQISDGDPVRKEGYLTHLDNPVHFPRLPTLRKGVQVAYHNRFMNFNSVFIAVCASLAFMIGNFQRHGLQINPLVWIDYLKIDGQISFFPLVLIIPWPLFPIITLLIEKGLASGKLSDSFGKYANIFWITVISIYPMAAVAVYGRPIVYAAGFPMFLAYCGLILKTWSFAETNYWYRHKWLSRKKTSESQNNAEKVSNNKKHEQTSGADNGPKIEYPDNLTVKGLWYFLFLPTFCYQLNYPTTERRNYAAIAWRLAEFLLSAVAMFAVLQQWIFPTLQYLLPPYAKGHTGVLLERYLATIVTPILLWDVLFFFFFHTYGALLAEILCFADRKFYDDWWQAENIDKFWRKWNYPVHSWAVRHLYLPLLQRGYSQRFAKYSVFIFSGFFHEYFASGPLRIVRCYFLLLFCIQIVILEDLTVIVTKKFGREMGISLTCITEVLITSLPLLYLHDLIVTYSGVEELETYPYF